MKEKAKFLRVVCKNCKKEQVVFERCAMDVKCLNCGKLLAKSTGGRSEIIK